MFVLRAGALQKCCFMFVQRSNKIYHSFLCADLTVHGGRSRLTTAKRRILVSMVIVSSLKSQPISLFSAFVVQSSSTCRVVTSIAGIGFPTIQAVPSFISDPSASTESHRSVRSNNLALYGMLYHVHCSTSYSRSMNSGLPQESVRLPW